MVHWVLILVREGKYMILKQENSLLILLQKVLDQHIYKTLLLVDLLLIEN